MPFVRRALVAALAAVAVAAPGLARAGDGGDRPFVPQNLLQAAAANRHETFHVIVTGAEGKSARALEHGELREAGTGADEVTRRFRVIDALAVDLEGHQILWLAKKAGIRSIVPDAPVVASSFDPLELWPSVVGVDSLWQTTAPD